MKNQNKRDCKVLFSYVRMALVNEPTRRGEESLPDWKEHDFYYPNGSHLFESSATTYGHFRREEKSSVHFKYTD